MQEIWKPVVGYEGIYEVSNLGNVCAISFNRTGIRKIIIGGYSNGYRQVGLSIHGKVKKIKVHRLVAQAFIQNTNNKPFVNHVNGIKTDNRIDNLEWCTAKENSVHAVSNGLQVGKKGIESHFYGVKGSYSFRAKKVINIETSEIFGCVIDAAKSINMNYDNVVKKLNGVKKNNTNLRYL